MSFKSARVESLQGFCEDWTEIGPNNLYGVDFQNSWVNYNTSTHESAAFMKDKFNRVWLKGSVMSGTVGSVPVFTVPASYRPDFDVQYCAIDFTGTPAARVVISSDGHVEIRNGNNGIISLDGISWRV